MDPADGSLIFRNYHMTQDNMAPTQTGNDIEIISTMSKGGHMGDNISIEYMNLNQVPCHICNKMFNSKRNKYLHVRYVHQNIRNHACQFCGRRFHKKSDVTRHHAIHYRNNHTPMNGFKTEKDNSLEEKECTEIETVQKTQADFVNNEQSSMNEISEYSRMENGNSLGMIVSTDFDTAQQIEAAFVKNMQSSMNEMSEYYRMENGNSLGMKIHSDFDTAQKIQTAFVNNVQSNINEMSEYSRMENGNSLGMIISTDFDTAQQIEAAFVKNVQSSMNEMSEYSRMENGNSLGMKVLSDFDTAPKIQTAFVNNVQSSMNEISEYSRMENGNSSEMKESTHFDTAPKIEAAFVNNVQSNRNKMSEYSRMENSNSLRMKVRTDLETAQKIQVAFVNNVQSRMNEMSKYSRTSINSSPHGHESQNENVFTSERAKKTHSINTNGLSLAAQRLLLYVLAENLTCCPVCNKLYSSKYSLKEHIRYVHNNVRNHACEVCGKRFYKKSDVVRHVLVHEKKPLSSPSVRGRPSTDPFNNLDTGEIEIIQEEGEVMMQEEEDSDSVVEMMTGAVLFCDVRIDDKNDQRNRFMKAISTVKIPQVIDNSKMISNQTSEKVYYEKNHEIIILDNAKEPQVLKITSLNNRPELNRYEDQNQKIKDIWSPLRLCQQNDKGSDHTVIRKPSVIRICGQQDQNFNKCQKCGALFTYKGLLETHSCSLTCKDTYEGSIILECEEGPVFDRSDYEEGPVFDRQVMIEYE